MKRLFSILLVVALLCGTLVLPASAAGSGSLSMSTATGNRGDTVTLSVYLNSNPGLVTMTIRVSYDTSVLQMVGASNTGLLAGAQMNSSYGSPYTICWVDGVSTTNNTSTGTIATFTFKILDTAAFGSTAVYLQFVDSYDTDYNANSFGAGSGSVTVVCNHNYGGWTKVDDNDHGKTCSICGGVAKESHAWGGDKVIKEATCKEGGQVEQTCSGCSAKRIVPTDPTTDHEYGSVTKLDDTYHGIICSVCDDVQKETHTWSGETTKEPNCIDQGVTTYTCSGCNATKTEPIPVDPTAHNYGSCTKLDDKQHGKTCANCGDIQKEDHSWGADKVIKEATCKESGQIQQTCLVCFATKIITTDPTTEHKYDNACDKDCNVCGVTRETSHQYKTTWSKDKNEHWHECAVCKDKTDVAAHTPNENAGPDDAVLCTICNYVIKPKPGHKHSYANKWTTDENGHWYACSGCEEKGSYAEHDFENACDPDCSVCGYTREIKHVFEEAWASDEKNHWHECTECGLKQDEEAHIPGAEATETTSQVCVICDYEIAPALGVDETTAPTENVDETTAPTTPAEPDGSATTEFPWWIIIVIAAAVVGVVIVVTKKKKQ